MKPQGEQAKFNVLIVDNEINNIYTLFRSLKNEYNVSAANSGKMALEKAQNEKPDIILLDVMMPDMDGYEMLKKLKSSNLTSDIPVILISDLVSPSAETKGLFLGAVDYISRPFNVDVVRARVKTHLQIKKNMRMIERLGMIDPLTEVPNRRRFEQQLEIDWAWAIREQTPISLLMIEIDDFKAYNDTYGHPASDALLWTFAKTATLCLKRPVDLLARIGGEEFAVLLPATNMAGAAVVGENIRAALESLNIPGGVDPLRPVTASMGAVSIVPGRDADVADFVARCDERLYAAKKTGKNKLFYCGDELPSPEPAGSNDEPCRDVARQGNVSDEVNAPIDILTRELRQIETELAKRLELENLVLDITQSFVTGDDLMEFINYALLMMSRFMGIDDIVLAKYSEDEQRLAIQFACGDKEKQALHHLGGSLPFCENTPLYDAIQKNGKAPIVYNGADGDNPFAHIKESGLKAFLAVPLYVADRFWGVLEFDRYERAYAWNEKELFLGKLIGNILAGTLARQSAEIQLQHAYDLLNGAPQFISYIDIDGNFEFMNPAAYEITGYSHDELMTGGVKLFFDDQTRRRIAKEIVPEIIAQGKCEFDIPLIRKDGEMRIMSFVAFEVAPDQNRRGCIGTDITVKRRLQQEIIEAKRIAEQANKAKGEFLSRMSHEMRTPLNAITGMSTVAKTSQDFAKIKDCLSKIDSASSHLLSMVNDILDMAKIESGKLELSHVRFSVRKMLENIADTINFRLKIKGQALIVDVKEGVPAYLMGDETRLSQVITNLLTNSNKFTPDDGVIALTVNKLDELEGVCTLQVVVEDNGIGVLPEQQSRIFTVFEQADGGVTRNYGGTGLGLPISKRLIELMGGKIWVESEAERGSKFIFTIKAKKDETRPEDEGQADMPPAADAFQGRTFLVAEDVDINREIIAAILEDTGVALAFAENGTEAVALYRDRPDLYSLILMDINMPEMDGYEATRHIRALGSAKAKRVPIIAMTANVYKEDVERCLAAGMNDHVGKPIDLDDLLGKLNKCLG